VVPPGLVTFSRNRAGLSCDCRANSPAPATVARASRNASSAGKPAFLAGFGQRLDQQKDIGGTAAGHRGHRIEQPFIVNPGALADRGEQRAA
jgi:hypothetical protein